jgi:hypothetical protein
MGLHFQNDAKVRPNPIKGRVRPGPGRATKCVSFPLGLALDADAIYRTTGRSGNDL